MGRLVVYSILAVALGVAIALRFAAPPPPPSTPAPPVTLTSPPKHRANAPRPASQAPTRPPEATTEPEEHPAEAAMEPKGPAAGQVRVVEPPAATEPSEWTLLDQAFGCYVGEAKTGWVRVMAKPAEPRGGRKLVALREEHLSRSRSQIAHMTRETTLTLDALLDDADLSVVEMSIQEVEADRVTTTEVTRDERGYEVATTLDGRRQARRVDGTAPVCGSWDLLLMRLAAAGKLAPGVTNGFLEFDLGVPRAVEKTVRAISASKEEYEVEFDEVHAWLDARGVTSRAEVGGMSLKAEPLEVARRMPRSTVTFRDDMRIDFDWPRHDGLDEVVLSVRVNGDKAGDLFLPSEYQRVEFRAERNEGVYRLTMLPYRAKEAAERARTEAECDLAEYLEPTPMVQCDDPEIVAKAKEITKGAEDLVEKVRRLAAWIHVNLGKRYTEVAGLSAKETLRQMAGDCSEHATLFDALARAIGVPVRECSGFVFLDKEGGRHAWSQVFLGGKWIHVDCVLNTLGADPRYILFHEHLPGQPRDLTYGRRMTHLETHPPRVRVESFTLWGRHLTPEEARESVHVADGRYENPMIGLAVRLPEGWKGLDAGDLGSASFTREVGGFALELRMMPYAIETVRKYFSRGGSDWKEVELAGRAAFRRGRISNASVDAHWAIALGADTLVIDLSGEGEASRAAYAEAERMLGAMELR